jgi:FkbM family methyltransferase
MTKLSRTVRDAVRPVIESRAPFAATVYRSFRDELAYLRAEPRMTTNGFYLCGNTSMEDGSFEIQEQHLLRSCLPDTDVFVDVGANIGFFSALARSTGTHVVAIEPVPTTVRMLQKNLRANGWSDVEVWPMAVGASAGIVDIYGGGTGASLVEGWAGISSSYRRHVSVTTVDQILRGRFKNHRLFVKIDVEGFEFEVLKGAVETLDRVPRPTWLLEITLSELRNELNPRYEETFTSFLSRGYTVMNVGPAGLRPVSRADIADWVSARLLPAAFGHNWFFRTP